MILPILAYGFPVLKKVGADIDKDYPNLKELIENMFETMYAANGVGLAAPQINLSIKLVVIDATIFEKEKPETKGFKKVFINPQIVKEEGEEWIYNEGCLSIPEVNEDVSRKSFIQIQYYDENFDFHDEKYFGILARIILHECDHVYGKLFYDRLSPLKKMLLKRRIAEISAGNVTPKYKMIFPKPKKKK